MDNVERLMETPDFTERGMDFVLAVCSGLGLSIQCNGEEDGLAAACVTGGPDRVTGAVRRLELRVIGFGGPLARPASGLVAVDVPEAAVRRWAAAPDPVVLVSAWPDDERALWIPVKERCGPPRTGTMRRLWLNFEKDRFDGRFGGIPVPDEGGDLTIEEVYTALSAVAGRHADLQTLCMMTFGCAPDAISQPGPTGTVLTALIARARMEGVEERLIAIARRQLGDTDKLRALSGRRFPDSGIVSAASEATPTAAAAAGASADLVLDSTEITDSNASITVLDGMQSPGTKGTLTVRGSVVKGSTLTIVGIKT